MPAVSLLAALLAFGEASAQATGALTGTEPLPAATDIEAVSSAAGASGRQAGGTDAAAAGQSGRQLPPPPAAPASLSGSGPGPDREGAVARAFECPREKIVRMLGAAVDEFEVSSSMELEREVLVLCRDRWQVLGEIMDAELSLAAILRKDRVAREKAALELEERRRLARARIEGARQGAAEAARVAEERRLRVEAALQAPEAPVKPKEETPAAADPAPAVAVVEEPEPKPHERFTWFTIIGAAGSLRAGVTDGEARWMVREGDRLPGGVRVTAISARPPRVRVAGGPARGLPYRGSR